MENSLADIIDWYWFLEEVRMDLKAGHSTIIAIIKDPLSQLWNQKWVKYLGATLISLGHLNGDIKMEIVILLFSLSEMIFNLSSLNVSINHMKFIMAKILWLVLDLMQVDSA